MGEVKNTKLIAKNTLALYFRMLLTLCISLYTARVILAALGFSDYGLYNVVGGILALFTFINGSLISSTQRFISFAIGKGDKEYLNMVFNTTVRLQYAFAALTFLIGETVGLWFLNTYIKIPAGREFAANIVFQFSIFAAILSVLQISYSSVVVAHEKMSVYAYLSILDSILKLAIAFSISLVKFDHLIFYAIATFGAGLVSWSIYRTYSYVKFDECRSKSKFSKDIVQEMASFAGWNIIGNLAWTANTQGINILINIFFGATVNAARAIAYQVSNVVNQFVQNLMFAINPQITKSFASDDGEYMQKLIFWGSKLSFFLLLFLSLPVFLEAPSILGWWLKSYPEYSVIFCRLVLIDALIACISGPLMSGSLATGKIKKYQIVVGLLYLSVLPIAYIVLKLGGNPQSTLYVSIFMGIILLYARLYMLSPMINLSMLSFFSRVIIPIVIVTLVSPIFPIIVHFYISNALVRFLCVGIVSVISTIISIYTLGLNQGERSLVYTKVKQYIQGIYSH